MRISKIFQDKPCFSRCCSTVVFSARTSHTRRPGACTDTFPGKADELCLLGEIVLIWIQRSFDCWRWLWAGDEESTLLIGVFFPTGAWEAPGEEKLLGIKSSNSSLRAHPFEWTREKHVYNLCRLHHGWRPVRHGLIFFFLSRVNKTSTVTVNNPWLGIIALIRRGTSNAVLFCLSRWDVSPAPPRLRGLLLCSGLRAEEDKIRIMTPVSSLATWRLWLGLFFFVVFLPWHHGSCGFITATQITFGEPCVEATLWAAHLISIKRWRVCQLLMSPRPEPTKDWWRFQFRLHN